MQPDINLWLVHIIDQMACPRKHHPGTVHLCHRRVVLWDHAVGDGQLRRHPLFQDVGGARKLHENTLFFSLAYLCSASYSFAPYLLLAGPAGHFCCSQRVCYGAATPRFSWALCSNAAMLAYDSGVYWGGLEKYTAEPMQYFTRIKYILLCGVCPRWAGEICFLYIIYL